MSKLQKNTDTVLIINGEIYILVREKFPKENGVCHKCSLYDECWKDTETPMYTNLCIPSSGYEGWFFERSLLIDEDKTRRLVELIHEAVVI